MTRLPGCLMALLLLIVFPAQAVDIYVSPTGSDLYDGSKERPLHTIAAALRKSRELRRLEDPSVSAGIHIILNDGQYQLRETLVLRPEDAGIASSPTFFQAAPGAHPVISGGQQITNWQKLSTKVTGLPAATSGRLWVADVAAIAGTSFEFRQLWVAGKKAIRAKTGHDDSMSRILSWNKKEQSCWVPTPANFTYRSGMEMFIHQWWAIAVLRIKKAEVRGDSTKLFFEQPESKIQSEHPWPAPWISKETGNSAFYLVNAIGFLDEPGEWWLDIINRKLYYWPLPEENMRTAEAVAPAVETLVRVEGSREARVTNISFTGISFQYSTWLRPSQAGHVPHQVGMYMTEAYQLRPAGTATNSKLDNQAWVGRPAAAVEVSFASNINFNDCSFEHLASTGLDYHRGVSQNHIRGNLFRDIGGTAILAGEFSNASTEIHLPFNPKEPSAVCDSITISDNLVTDVTNEDWSCVGIGLGYTKNSVVEHNEIENVSYSGISMGWGWTAAENVMENNSIVRNKIHHFGKHNYDCAGIYTLSAQKNSLISENYIDSVYKAPYAHLPSHWFYIYTDEGSSFLTVKNNWTPSPKFLQNANGPGNEWINNGPTVSSNIRFQAGLQANYAGLATQKTAHTVTLPINREHPEIIELITAPGNSIDIAKLKLLLHNNKMDSSALYQWQNHYVIFDKVQDVSVMQGRLQNNFPGAQVKVYHDLFYEFNRSYCGDTSTAREWDHIILTADLVADQHLQNEYLQHHKTQFQRWPELAKGFCNARFQQLLIFKNQRQLMLVISIPKGENFETLNPRTSQGNPRVDEWNKLMSKYQQGISGTSKGESWVFLKKIL